ncbi:MAG: hypothetical protein RIR26_1986, partial [Pseudomonadota bacterium]
GHCGSLCTLHGRDAAEALDRFECLILQAQPSLSSEVVRRMILSSIDCVVVLGRSPSGGRAVAKIVLLKDGGTERGDSTHFLSVGAQGREFDSPRN